MFNRQKTHLGTIIEDRFTVEHSGGNWHAYVVRRLRPAELSSRVPMDKALESKSIRELIRLIEGQRIEINFRPEWMIQTHYKVSPAFLEELRSALQPLPETAE